jgi:hypothetical protein
MARDSPICESYYTTFPRICQPCRLAEIFSRLIPRRNSSCAEGGQENAQGRILLSITCPQRMHDLGRALVAVGEFSIDEIIYKGSASSDVE